MGRTSIDQIERGFPGFRYTVRNPGQGAAPARPGSSRATPIQIPIVVCLGLAILVTAPAAGRKTAPALTQGVKTPGVQIHAASLKADAELAVAPEWMVFADSVLVRNPQTGSLDKLDAIRVGHGSVWLSNLREQNVWRFSLKQE